MSPEVTAAIIAASVSFLTLIGTLAAQYFGRRATSKQLDRTLGEQRARTLNERFATAAEQLGSDKPAVRLAGVYAMAGLADDWEENRQTCVDVLCAYLRMPYEPDPGEDAPKPQRLASQAIREVRHTVIRVITQHLKKDAAVSWQRLNFDFTGAVFDGGNFREAQFSGGIVRFSDANFVSGRVLFEGAKFCGGEVWFGGAKFCSGEVNFSRTEFSGGKVAFPGAEFRGGWVLFEDAKFSGGEVDFPYAEFSGGQVDFGRAEFSGGRVIFIDTVFSGGQISFYDAEFSGSQVLFLHNAFSGGRVDFSRAAVWTHPPMFDWGDTPPSGVQLPRKADQSEA
jgi:hypothetical protein